MLTLLELTHGDNYKNRDPLEVLNELWDSGQLDRGALEGLRVEALESSTPYLHFNDVDLDAPRPIDIPPFPYPPETTLEQRTMHRIAIVVRVARLEETNRIFTQIAANETPASRSSKIRTALAWLRRWL